VVRLEDMMAGRAWTAAEYNRLEAAISSGSRVAVLRHGSEMVIVPRRLGMRGGRESIEAVHPATGEVITIMLDEIERFELVT
jgi:hypothetical protein